MTNKSVNWTQIGFRPGREEGIMDISRQPSIKVVPNPFTKSFQLAVKGQNKHQIFRLSLFDVSGKKFLHLKGTVPSINAQIAESNIDRFPPGHYFLNLLNKRKEKTKTFKVEKLK